MREIDNQSRKSSSSRQTVYNRGLNDALWACVLNDYIDDDEEEEFAKIIGEEEMAASAACISFPRTQSLTHKRLDAMLDPRASDFRVGVSSSAKSKRRNPPPAMLLALQNQDVESIPQISKKWEDQLRKFEEQQSKKKKQGSAGDMPRSSSTRTKSSSASTKSRAKSRKAPATTTAKLPPRLQTSSRSRSETFAIAEEREHQSTEERHHRRQPSRESGPRDLPPRTRSSRPAGKASQDWVDQVPMQQRERSTKSSAQSTAKSVRSLKSRTSSMASTADRSHRNRTPRRMFSRISR
jgi:hypothetical protein